MKISKITVARLTAVLVSISAIATIAGDSVLFSNTFFLRDFWELQDTEWVSTHSVVVSMALLYLAWSLWHRSRNAWRIVTVLIILEIFRSGFVLGNQLITLIYGALLVILILARKAFDKNHTTVVFRKRLKRALFVVILTAVAVSALSLSFRYYQTRQIEKDALSANNVIVKTLLLDQSVIDSEPKSIKLLNNLLFVAGTMMYIWILSALFLPSILDQFQTDHADAKSKLIDLLNEYSVDSEDSFKVWPTDKKYWSSDTHKAVVAYKQKGKFAFALADPICDPRNVSETIRQFNEYCRGHGVTASWLLVDESRLEHYKNNGLMSINIGASALISIEEFSTKTVNEKWWRWVRNKSKKQGLSYKVLTTPLSHNTLKELAKISDSWIQANHHTERTFALGYFDSSYLQNCTIHTLVNEKGEVVAFANQLPRYNNARCATIDLMRSLPEAQGAMALLLSELILSLHQGGEFTHFDLGFVPLTHKHKEEDSASQTLLRKAVKPVFSIEGLEQFKSKFEPEWHAKYIAWDGDKILVPHMTAALLRTLSK